MSRANKKMVRDAGFEPVLPLRFKDTVDVVLPKEEVDAMSPLIVCCRASREEMRVGFLPETVQ
jgi:hypothetical protein